MAFRQKVEEAAVFAEKLPGTAAALYVNDASDGEAPPQEHTDRTDLVPQQRGLRTTPTAASVNDVPAAAVEALADELQTLGFPHRP